MENPLGRKTLYPEAFDPSQLYSVERALARRRLPKLSFEGYDIWNCYELYWQTSSGIPKLAILRLKVPCESPYLIESKSLKLFLGSLNNTVIDTQDALLSLIQPELCRALGIESSRLGIELFEPKAWHLLVPEPKPAGICIEENLSQPKAEEGIVHERLYTNLLRSICPVTAQPDWASVEIEYQGTSLNRSNLLEYLLKFKSEPGFHEDLCERIFCEILSRYNCLKLRVACYFTRRGGIDINPTRFTPGAQPFGEFKRWLRQ